LLWLESRTSTLSVLQHTNGLKQEL
jgi:hypothetical protein